MSHAHPDGIPDREDRVHTGPCMALPPELDHLPDGTLVLVRMEEDNNPGVYGYTGALIQTLHDAIAIDPLTGEVMADEYDVIRVLNPGRPFSIFIEDGRMVDHELGDR